MTPAITITDISKRYQLGLTHAGSIRDLANRIAKRFVGGKSTSDLPATVEDSSRVEDGYFWALKDINFQVSQGEVIGIIGKNGAGKSTLLKLLSRITFPTSGRAELRGRVASLLEVGTGFHPELTGRENVFLNGTILGMTRREIDRQLDNIVEFAGVSKFLDTPVKRYSSGMKVRLGFAVAAHLDPEILIVDEVLAVGDVEFQKRCLGKMQSVAESGKTVLFVSHNLASIRGLTQRCVVLSQGRVICDGPTDEAVTTYIKENLTTDKSVVSISEAPRAFSGLDRKLEFVDLNLEGLTQDGCLIANQSFTLRAAIRAKETVGDYILGLTIYSRDKTAVGSTFTEQLEPPRSGSTHEITLSADFPLAPGEYHCAISISDARSEGKSLHDSLSEILPFSVPIPATDLRGWNNSWGSIRLPKLQTHSTVKGSQ